MSNWPQWWFLALYVWSALLWIVRDGQPRGEYDAGYGIAGSIIGVWVLWMGGFFAPLGW